MKRLLIAALFAPAIACAQAEPFHSFTNGNTDYNIMPTTIRLEGKQVVALWNVTSPTNSWRWKVYISNCGKPYGTIYAKMDGAEHTSEWAIEGDRVYDYLAAYTCLSHTMKPTK